MPRKEGCRDDALSLKRAEGTSVEEHNERQRLYGQALRAALEELLDSEEYLSITKEAREAVEVFPEYRGMDPEALAAEEQRAEVEKLVRQIRREFSAYEKSQRSQ